MRPASSTGHTLNAPEYSLCPVPRRHVLCRSRCGSPVRLLLHHSVKGVGEPFGGEVPEGDRVGGGAEGSESARPERPVRGHGDGDGGYSGAQRGGGCRAARRGAGPHDRHADHRRLGSGPARGPRRIRCACQEETVLDDLLAVFGHRAGAAPGDTQWTEGPGRIRKAGAEPARRSGPWRAPGSPARTRRSTSYSTSPSPADVDVLLGYAAQHPRAAAAAVLRRRGPGALRAAPG